MTAATVFGWRASTVGLAAMAAMCSGDGLADMVGRRFGRGNAWGHNPAKSQIGSLAMGGGGFGVACLLTSYFHGLGYLEVGISSQKVAWVLMWGSWVAAAVESLVPVVIPVDDNLAVPIAAGTSVALALALG